MKVEKMTEVNAANLETLMTIWLQGNQDAHGFVAKDYWRNHEQEVADQLKSATIYVVRGDNGELLGFASMHNRQLVGLFVKAGHRDQGIGSLLMFALKSDYKLIKVTAFEKNTRAIQFYKQHAFAISERELNQGLNEVEVKMQWQV